MEPNYKRVRIGLIAAPLQPGFGNFRHIDQSENVLRKRRLAAVTLLDSPTRYVALELS